MHVLSTFSSLLIGIQIRRKCKWHDFSGDYLSCNQSFRLAFAANIVIGSGSLLGRFLSLPSHALYLQNNRMLPPPLSPVQVCIVISYKLILAKIK
jgi:acetyltransferase-like isoleucine patch superfamily enzyme